MRIVRKGPTEFEVNAEGERGGKIYAHIRTGDYDKLLLIQVSSELSYFLISKIVQLNCQKNGLFCLIILISINSINQFYLLENKFLFFSQ